MAYPIMGTFLIVMGILAMSGAFDGRKGYVVFDETIDNWNDWPLFCVSLLIGPLVFVIPLALAKFLYEEIKKNSAEKRGQ